MKLGARIIKTGIAVTLSLYAAEMIGLEPVIFAALAAVLAVQPSLYRSWQNIIDQLQANFIGAVLAILFTSFLGNSPFVVGLVVILVIAINIQLKLEKSIPLAIVTVIAIMESITGNFYLFAFERFMLILIGIGASALVNVIFLPPRYEDKLYTQIHDMTADLLTYLRSSTFHDLQEKPYREETKRLKDELIKIEQLYLLFKEERTYFRKMKYSKTRKLVLFRKMLFATNHALQLFTYLERHQLELSQIPYDVQKMIQREIELITNYHEKILLKYEGKLKSHHPHLPYTEVFTGRRNLLDQFVQLYNQKRDRLQQEVLDHYNLGRDESPQSDARKKMMDQQRVQKELERGWSNLFPLFAHIVDYSNELERLDKLVEGYHSFH